MTEEPFARLIVEKGIDGLSEIPLNQTAYQLGSAKDADVVLDNASVSRLHAQIIHHGGRFQIRDLGSKNGTFVNGTRVGADNQPLRNGDRVELPLDQMVLTFKERSGTLTLALPKIVVAPPPEAVEGDIVVDSGSREVWVRGDKVEPALSRKEFDILNILYEKVGNACSRDEIGAAGWPERDDPDVTDQEIDPVHPPPTAAYRGRALAAQAHHHSAWLRLQVRVGAASSGAVAGPRA